MIQVRWTTEKERQDLHERSLKNIGARTRMERTRVLPKEMAGRDLDKIPPGEGEKFDCGAELRRRANVEGILAAVHDAWPKRRLAEFPRHLGRRHLREEIEAAWRAFEALDEIKPTQPWAVRRRKCETVAAALDAVVAALDDREGQWLAEQLRVSPYYRRAFDANLDIGEFDTWLTSPPKLRRFMPGSSFLRTARYSAAKNSGDAWIKAILLKNSIAAVGEKAMADCRKTYLPQPGDDRAAIEHKRQLRQLRTDGLKMPLMAAQVEQSKDEIRRVLQIVKGDPSGVPLERNGSAMQSLVGERLPLIFERWFYPLKVSVDQSKKALIALGETRRYAHRTPFIAFATAVLAERGVPITPATTAILVKAAKRGTRN